MLKTFLWLASEDTTYIEDALKILEHQHNGIELVGVTAHIPINIAFNGKNIPFVPLNKLDALGGVYDVLIVIGAKKIGMSKITQAARQLNLPEEKLLGDWIACIPGFTLNKYRRLQRSRLSIISKNCFGGIISHTLGLPFRSPIVNMYFLEQEYIHFLSAPQLCMSEKLILKKMVWNDGFKHYHPIATLGNVDIVLNHYHNFDEAFKIWERRKARINWYNLFVTMYTEDEKILEDFDALPYGKKVCFVPFKSDLDSAWYINPEIDFDRKEKGFYDVVNNFARGKIFYYDPFDMLLYGKKTPRIDM